MTYQLTEGNLDVWDRFRKAGQTGQYRAQALVIGDSISEGTGATTAANRWQTLLQQSLSPSGPTFPFIPAWPVTPVPGFPVTRTGSVRNSDDLSSRWGLGWRTAEIYDDDGVVEFTFTGTAFEIAYSSTATTGIMTYSVDGGVSVDVNTNETPNDLGNTVQVLGLVDGPHTVTIQRSPSSTAGQMVWVQGLLTYRGDETAGVRILDAAQAGISSRFWPGARLLATFGNPTGPIPGALQGAGGADLLMYAIGTNDYSGIAVTQANNFSFETNGDWLTLGSVASITQTSAAGTVLDGTFAAQITINGAPVSTTSGVGLTVAGVEPGEWVGLQIPVRPNGATPSPRARVRIEWRDGADVGISSSTSTVQAVTANTYTTLTHTAQAPAGTASARVYLFLSSAGSLVPLANSQAATDEWQVTVALTQVEADAAVDTREYAARTTMLIDAARDYTPDPFTGNVLLIGMYLGAGRDPLLWEQFHARLAEIAAADDLIAYVDLRQYMPSVDSDTSGLYSDNLHPTDFGYARMAAIFSEILAAPARSGPVAGNSGAWGIAMWKDGHPPPTAKQEQGISLEGGDAIVPYLPTEPLGCLTEPPLGLGVPTVRNGDVVFAQRDGVVQFADYYEPRILTFRVSICNEGCPGCPTGRQKVKRLTKEWSRNCDGANLVIFTDCHNPAASGEEQEALGPYIVHGRPRVADVTWLPSNVGCADIVLRFDCEDARLRLANTPFGVDWDAEQIAFADAWNNFRSNRMRDPRLTATVMSLNGATVTDTYEAFGGPDGGSFFRRVMITANTSSPMSMPMVGSGTSGIPVVAGTTYTASWYARKVPPAGVATRMNILWYDAAGVLLSTVTGAGGAPDGNWSRFSETAVAPALAAFAEPRLQWSGTALVGQVLDVAQAQFETGAVATSYFDGDYTGARWTGTANASASRIAEAETFEVFGDLCAFPVFNLFGTLTGPTEVTYGNVIDGYHTFTYTPTIASGGLVVVDTQYGIATSSGVEVTQNLSGDYNSPLSPGLNELYVTTTVAGDNGSVSVLWENSVVSG